MEIKDKLTARQVAMEMATTIMVAAIPRLPHSHGYDSEDHMNLAQDLYDWIVGNAELPEVYDQESLFSEVLSKIDGGFKTPVIWLSIPKDEKNVPTSEAVGVLRRCIPIFLRSANGEIKVIGNKEEFDKIVDSGALADYTEYSMIFDPDPKHPLRE